MRNWILMICLFAAFTAAAQDKVKQIGVGAQLFYSNVYWLETSAKTDTLNMPEKGFVGISPQLWYIIELKRYSHLQVGLNYTLTGFQRRAENVQYRKQYHPDIPVTTDNYQGDPRHIDFFYRHHYLALPVFYNLELTSLRKSISLHYFFTPGLSFGYNLYSKTIAKTRGYGFDGKNRFALNNIYEVNPISIQLHLAGRMEYVLENRYRAHVQPIINIPITSVFKGNDRALTPSLGVNVFLTLLPGAGKTKD